MDFLYSNEHRTYEIIGAAIEVHTFLGPGFLEAVYQEAMEIELKNLSIPFESQKRLSIRYKDTFLEKEYVADLVCYGSILVELKALKEISSIHTAQVINYLRVTDIPIGLLLNFGSFGKLEKKRLYCKPYSRGWVPDKGNIDDTEF